MRTPVVVLEHLPEPHEPAPTPAAHAYERYPEFTGPGGERYLKKLLRQILPMALYRTWDILTDHQARGNDCYLSIPTLATLASRSLRTMQKNLATLSARHLLVERAERKVFLRPEGGSTSRMVIIKDFTALYALAHEYHEWLCAEAYIPPDRLFLPMMSQEPMLVAKLRRFENYRKVLYTRLSGPGPRMHEEDGWFSTSRLTDVGTTEKPDERSGEEQTPTSVVAPFLPTSNPAKEVSKPSPKRKNESSHGDDEEGDSSDSVRSFSEPLLPKEEEGRKAPCPPRTQSEPEKKRRSPEETSVPKKGDQPTHHRSRDRSGLGEASPHPAHAREDTRQAVRLARQAMTLAGLDQPGQPAHGWGHDQRTSLPRPPDHPLARTFVHEIATPFGDRNPKGSTTRVLRMIANAGLEESEVVLCLVRAATIARETRTIRPAHQETGRANRMPLFCTLFERFVQARVQHGRWNYSWQQMEDDLVADDRLLLWWTEHQAFLTKATRESDENPRDPVVGVGEDQREAEEASPLVIGWASREAAHAWGERLLEALIAAGYEAEARVHLEGQWYQLVLVGEDCELVLETPQQVQWVMEQLQQGTF